MDGFQGHLLEAQIEGRRRESEVCHVGIRLKPFRILHFMLTSS
jgi:hypothetical protein